MINNSEISVSIILLCFNPSKEKFLQTFFSCTSQSGVFYEIIVSDDGSKNTEWWDSKLKEKKNGFCRSITFNRNRINLGTVSNIDSALKIASGRYIKCISPGDYFYSNQSLKMFFDYCVSKKACLVYGKEINYYHDSCSVSKIPFCFLTNLKLFRKNNVLFHNDHLHGANILVEKQWFIDCVEKIKGRVIYCEDFPLIWLTLLSSKKIAYLRKYTLFYEHGTGISGSCLWKEKMNVDLMRFLNILGEFYPNSKEAKKTILLRSQKKKNALYLLTHALYKICGYVSTLFKKIIFLFRRNRFNNKIRLIKQNDFFEYENKK